jgi:hypothetical protein
LRVNAIIGGDDPSLTVRSPPSWRRRQTLA